MSEVRGAPSPTLCPTCGLSGPSARREGYIAGLEKAAQIARQPYGSNWVRREIRAQIRAAQENPAHE